MSIYTAKINEKFGLIEKERNVFYGEYKGYEITLHVVQQGLELYFNCFAPQTVKVKACNIFIETDNKSFTNATLSPFGLHLITNGMTVNSSLEKLEKKLEAVINYLNENGAKGVGFCMESGEETFYLETIKLNDVYVTLSKESVAKLNEEINKANEEFEQVPNNYFKGVVGAFIGVGIACIAWIILYFLGFFSVITAVLAVFLGNYFYVKMGGKANNTKTLIVAVISLVMLLLTCLFLYLYYARIFMEMDHITNLTPFEYIMKDQEMKSAFTSDMLMNAIFTVIGVLVQYSSTKKKDQSNTIRISK